MATRIEPTVGVTADGWVSVGVVANAHGVKGGLKLHIWSGGDSEVLRADLEVKLGSRVHRVVRYAPGLLELDGVKDRNAADALRGVEVFVRRADFPADEEEGDLYLVDLIGSPVTDESGAVLGTVEGFSDNGAQPLCSVARAGAPSVLVPWVPAFVRVAEKGRVVLAPPRGLFVDEDALE